MNDPIISVIHPTARVRPYPSFPTGWRAAMEHWYKTADHPERIEYILVVHQSRWDEFNRELAGVCLPNWGSFRAVQNPGADTNVAQVNLGASVSTGEVMVGTMDDLYSPDHWDQLIVDALPDVHGEYVLQCGTGSPRDLEPLVNAGSMTRKRYERYGYVCHPSYESMYADNELSAVAVRDKVLVQRLDIEFEHRHPSLGKGLDDEIYQLQNRDEAYQRGAVNFLRRQAQGFSDATRRRIIVCLPGQTFSMRWVSAMLRTIHWLGANFEINVVMGYSSNVYMTRADIAQQCLEPGADFVLWIDDDNPVEPSHVEKLITDLDSISEIDVIAGWCVCSADSFESPVLKASAGFFDGLKQQSLELQVLEDAQAIVKVDWTGFPLVLMRQSVLRAIHQPFRPMPNENTSWGFDGEDLSFSRRLAAAGFTLAVDPRVKVPHLKLRDSNRDELSPAVAGMKKGEN